MKRHRLLSLSLLGIAFFGAGCALQGTRPVPKEAQTVLTNYLNAIRTGDITAIGQALCQNIDQTALVQQYQTMFEVDRTNIANAFQDAVPDDAGSTDTRLEFVTNVDLTTGYLTRTIDLHQMETNWCITE